MKYIKKFNELKTSTYVSASKKLAKIGHEDRSMNIKQHGIDMKKKNLYSNTDKLITQYAKYGIFNYKINDFVGNFYLKIDFLDDMFNDIYDVNDFNDNIIQTLPIAIDLIPANDETKDYVYNKFNESLSDSLSMECLMLWISLRYFTNDSANIKKYPNIKSFPTDAKYEFNDLYKDESTGDFYIYDGFNYIKKNCSVYVNSFDLETWGEYYDKKIEISDRSSALKLRKLLIEIFSNENFDYPTRNNSTIYDDLERTLLIQNSFSSDFGFEIESIGDYFKTISVNRFYK